MACSGNYRLPSLADISCGSYGSAPWRPPVSGVDQGPQLLLSEQSTNQSTLGFIKAKCISHRLFWASSWVRQGCKDRPIPRSHGTPLLVKFASVWADITLRWPWCNFLRFYSILDISFIVCVCVCETFIIFWQSFQLSPATPSFSLPQVLALIESMHFLLRFSKFF